MTAKELIQKHEGLRLAPYQCPTGHWSIGWGHNLEAHGDEIPESISFEQAQTYLDTDFADAWTACKALISNFDSLNSVRQAVTLDMAFNLGKEGFSKFKRLIQAITTSHWNQAAIEMADSKWAKQVGIRATEDAVMMATGEWI